MGLAEVGENEIAAIEREWAELSAQMKAHRDAGTDPSDLEVSALAERWRDLTERTIAGFTGGDPGITESLGRMYKEKGPEKASRGTFDADPAGVRDPREKYHLSIAQLAPRRRRSARLASGET
jgi:hypothetical protein